MNYQEMVDLVRTYIGFPEPAAGATDRLSNTDILRWLNDGFDKMSNEVYGLEKYTEFEIQADGTITVTEPASGEDPPSITLNNPPLQSYPSFDISDLRSYVSFVNKTDGVNDDGRRIMKKKSIDDHNYQGSFNTVASFYRWYDLSGTNGFVLLPLTIDQTNTIGIKYRKDFTRNAVSTPVITGDGLDDITIGGIYTGTTTKNYRIEVTNDAPDPEIFRWSNDGGDTWTQSGLEMSTSAITLEDGLTVLWAATAGHTVTDYWDWTATAPSLSDFQENEQSGFPVHYACYQVAKQIRDMDGSIFRKDADRYLAEWIERRTTIDDTMDFSLDSPLRIRREDYVL